MAITINIYYKGTNQNASKFAHEMMTSGVVDAIRKESGNLRYDYFYSMENPQTLLLIDSWENQDALDRHHASPVMQKIIALREKYDLHMSVERYVSDDSSDTSKDAKYIRT